MAMRAISPVIATVIIVSVAIAISIAVALWLTGITSGFTQTENLQISSSYAEAGNYYIYIKPGTYYNLTFKTGTYNIIIWSNNTSPTTNSNLWIVDGQYGVSFSYVNTTARNGTLGWLVKISIKNTGTVAATIDNIFVNNIPIKNEKGIVVYNGTATTIDPGKNRTLYIFICSQGFSAGQMVNIKIHTASGRDYPTTVTLP